MRLAKNEEYHTAEVNRYLKEKGGSPYALIITVKQAVELLQTSRSTIYEIFNVVNGKIQKVEFIKYLSSLGCCKNV